MSVIIKVYSNHTLSFDNYADGIKVIENLLKIEIQDSENFDTLKNDTLNLNYFTRHDYFEKRYKENWGIWVHSNNKLCHRFVIHKHLVQFDISGELNLKTHIWQKLVAKQYDYCENWNKIDFDKTLAEWNNTRNYILEITKKLGGDTILYLNDGGELFQAEELIWEGNEIDSVISFLKTTSKFDKYDDLINNSKEFSQDNGFIETLK